MCLQKGHAFCSDLGTDFATWSNQTPLPRPESFKESWEHFKRALELLYLKDIEEARSLLERYPGMAEREWFDIHAQNSGEWRRKALKKSAPAFTGSLDPNKDFSKYLNTILARDNYRCRYCSHTVLPRKTLLAMHTSLGEDVFPLGLKNSEMSGFYLVLCATLDHVVPHSLGGRTDEQNLVTSCWPCNYGKMNYTLEQIGLEDPRTRAPLPLELPIEILSVVSNAR